MKKYIEIIILFLIWNLGYAQKIQTIRLPWVKNCNVIFPYNYGASTRFLEKSLRFTPTEDQIWKAETILMEQYNLEHIKSFDYANVQYKMDFTLNIAPYKYPYLKFVSNPKKELRNFRRQYIGYINPNKDSIIVISMFNFPDKIWKNEFECFFWTEFIIGYGGPFEDLEKVKYYSVNLSKEKLCGTRYFESWFCKKNFNDLPPSIFNEQLRWKWEQRPVRIFEGVGWPSVAEIGNAEKYIRKSLPAPDSCKTFTFGNTVFCNSLQQGNLHSKPKNHCYDTLGLRVFINNHKVCALEFFSRDYITSKNIKKGNSLKKVFRRYGTEYRKIILQDSLNDQYKNRTMILYDKQGIGFLLNEKNNRVASIFILPRKR